MRPDGEVIRAKMAEIEKVKAKELEEMLAHLDDNVLNDKWATDDQVVANGRETYLANCTACHGQDLAAKMDIGNGQSVPLPGLSLVDGQWKYGAKPMDIFKLINAGHTAGQRRPQRRANGGLGPEIAADQGGRAGCIHHARESQGFSGRPATRSYHRAGSPPKNPNVRISIRSRPSMPMVRTTFFIRRMSKGASPLRRRLVACVLIAVYAAMPWIPINGAPGGVPRCGKPDVPPLRPHAGAAGPVGDVLRDQRARLPVVRHHRAARPDLVRLGLPLHGVSRSRLTAASSAGSRATPRPAARSTSAPWTAGKISKRVSQARLSSPDRRAHRARLPFLLRLAAAALYGFMQEGPLEHATAFGIVTFLTLVLWFCFGYFREQFCIIMCPYGRLQSALTDDDTINVGYDEKRGEPRGAKGKAEGDCIDCRRCVQVCPTGIDIRNGLQLECIGCTACIDACDDIMTKVERPNGLIRYDSFNGLAGKKRRILRPRLLAYGLLGVLGLTALGSPRSSGRSRSMPMSPGCAARRSIWIRRWCGTTISCGFSTSATSR